MDDKYRFLAPGCTVIDCGASPGGWTQVAARRCNADQKGTLTSVICVPIVCDQQRNLKLYINIAVTVVHCYP